MIQVKTQLSQHFTQGARMIKDAATATVESYRAPLAPSRIRRPLLILTLGPQSVKGCQDFEATITKTKTHLYHRHQEISCSHFDAVKEAFVEASRQILLSTYLFLICSGDT